MSVVPLMFRDWWDELEFPMRTSRLLDQHFGQGLKRDDLMSSVWNSRPTVLRSGYLRPWHTNSLQKQESGSTLNIDSEKFEVILDVQQFSPSEITVKVADKFVIVEESMRRSRTSTDMSPASSPDATSCQVSPNSINKIGSMLNVYDPYPR